MNPLDDFIAIKKLDPSNMRGHLASLHEQVRKGWREAAAFKLPEDYSRVRKIVILGMGGSAIGGDLVRRLANAECTAPILVNRDYTLPAFVDGETLVIASSYSGNTEEVLSALSQATRRGAKRIAISAGGKLADVAAREGIPFLHFNYQAPPRAGLGYGFVMLLSILCRLGYLKDKSAEVQEAANVLEKLSFQLYENMPEERNLAKRLAAELQGRLIIIYGGGLLSEVAYRWKTQFNENSKAWAFHEVFPELNHNAIVGYRFPQEIAKKAYVVFLNFLSMDPRLLLRQRVTRELLLQGGISHKIVEAEGQGEISQMLSGAYIGDYVSFYLALLNKVDPTPVPAVDYLKERLEKEGQASPADLAKGQQ